jgi:lipopolysaccharide/colanic/teichoic acid biosynthesis glycosyltransferase
VNGLRSARQIGSISDEKESRTFLNFLELVVVALLNDTEIFLDRGSIYNFYVHIMYKKFGKRFIDILVSLSILILVSPLLLIVSLALAASNDGSFLFFQRRPGLNGRIFHIYKFKTMTDQRGVDGRLLPDSERTTTIGLWVRKFSLDELLQLVNVLKGDMSLIGPRPLLVDYLPYYSSRELRRHDVKPGVTGLAQVKGRNSISWRRRFLYDTFYVSHVSPGLDLMIALRTIGKVLKGSDVAPPLVRFDHYVVTERERKTGDKNQGSVDLHSNSDDWTDTECVSGMAVSR